MRARATLAAVGLAAVLAGCGGGESLPEGTPEAVDEVVTLEASTYSMATDGELLWVRTGDAGAAQIVLESGELGPSAPDALGVAFDQGRLWVSTELEVRELDPRTGETLRSAPIRGVSSWLAFGGGSMWVYRWSADREDVVSVLRIDPGTLRVLETIPVSRCSDAREVMYAAQGVWIACKGSGHVLRVSPETGEALTIATGGRPHQLAEGAGSVWVTNLENTVSRIDVSSSDVVATVKDIGAGAAIAFADGAIWAAGVYGLGRIDPSSNSIDAEIPLIPTGGDYYELVPVEGALWLSTVHRQEVWRVKLP